MKHDDAGIWSGHRDTGTASSSAWQKGYRTYVLRQSLTAFRLDPLRSKHAPKIWFAIGAVALPMNEYLATYAVLSPRVVANALGGAPVALDHWLLAPGSIVNVGAAGPQSPFGAGMRDFLLPGGAIQLELRPAIGPPPVFLGREPVTGRVRGY